MKKVVNVVVLFCLALPLVAQNYREEVKEGNNAYSQGKYTDAEVAYKKATKDKQASVEGTYNLGNTLFKQERFDEAINNFRQSIDMTDDPLIKAEAYHNLGNAYVKTEKLEDAIEAYKQALKLNPKDEQTRYNLAKSFRKMNQQKDQKKDDKKDKKDQQDDKNKKDDKKDDKGNPDDKKDDQKDKDKGDQNNPNKPEDGQDQKKKKRPQKGEISREDAKRLLETLARKEEALQKKMNQEKIKTQPVKTEKDW